MLHFKRLNPSSILQDYIQGYWHIQSGSQPNWLSLVPDGYPELFFVLKKKLITSFGNGEPESAPKAGFIGQLTQGFKACFEPNASVLYVKMYPWTPYLLFGVPLWQLNNRFIELDVLTTDKSYKTLGRLVKSSEKLEEAASLLDDFFLKKLSLIKKETPYLQYAVHQIYNSNGIIPVDSLRENIQASRRYVEKLFKREIGIAPKQYACLIRVKKASIYLLDKKFTGNIGTVASTLDYYDQSHFLKDFKSVVGQTPTEFLQQHNELPFDKMNEYLEQWDYS